MGYAWEFRAAATRMRQAAEDAEAVSSSLWRIADDHGIAGGRLQQVVDTTFSANGLNASSLAAQCTEIAEECDTRATACEDHLDAHQAWERSHARWEDRNRTYQRHRQIPDVAAVHPGPRPAPPKPPHTWIEI